MKQTSEKFAEMMLEAEQHETPVSFAEQIAKVEQQMTERINDMTDKILSSVAESQKVQLTELKPSNNDGDINNDADNDLDINNDADNDNE